MILLVAGLLLAALLFWFGLARSHWIAPAALFTASGPVVATLVWNDGLDRVVAFLLANLSLFYAAFALGRSMAGHESSAETDCLLHSTGATRNERFETRSGR